MAILLFRQPGVLPERALEELLTKAATLDMEAIRQEIRAGKAQHGA